MNFPINWRDRRNFLTPSVYPFATYCTDTKANMKHTFAEDLVFENFYLGADPLRKNLADTIITNDHNMATKNNKNKLEKEKTHRSSSDRKSEEKMEMPDNSPLGGISNFFSGVFSVISNMGNMMFSKAKPEEFRDSSPEMALPSVWHGAKISDENKILREKTSNDISGEIFASEMSDCHSAAVQCQSKLDHVRLLLGSSKPVPCSIRTRRRPKKVFVEPSSVEDCFEDAFSPEDFENLPSDSYLEYLSPVCYHDQVFHEVECPEMQLQGPKSIPDTSNDSLNVNSLNIPKVVGNLNGKPVPSVIETSMENTMLRTKLDEMGKDNLICESTEIVKHVPEYNITNRLENEAKKELVESCEDKITKLKLLLQERRKKPKTVIEPEMEPVHHVLPPSRLESELQPLVTLPPRPKRSYRVKDKRYKNPNRCTDKRKKSRMKRNINDDIVFANEINTEDLSSVENSPSTNNMEKYMELDNYIQNVELTQPKIIPQKEYFDEVSGKFHCSSVESDDSFQIVFNDSPRYRKQSDCDSEDSFIVFEESPDSCYTSHDVFGDTSDSDCDSDSDMSDSGCGVFKLSASLSKSVSNLADDSLYMDQSEDEVDCANVRDFTSDVADQDPSDAKGLMLTEQKKKLRNNLPAKKVHFSTEPPKVHVMRVWLFAAKQTRQRYWEQFVVDRDRFKRRINDVEMAVSWVLKPQHRSRVVFQRFMPWWNAQKRQEIAEKKEKDEKERLRVEEIENVQIEENNSSGVSKEDELRMEDVTQVTDENVQIGDRSVKNENICVNVPESEEIANDTLVKNDCENSKENTENRSLEIDSSGENTNW